MDTSTIIILTVLATFGFDIICGVLYKKYEKRQRKRDEDLFYFKLKTILEDESRILGEKVEDAKGLCRMTNLTVAAGAYMTLDHLSKQFFVNP